MLTLTVITVNIYHYPIIILGLGEVWAVRRLKGGRKGEEVLKVERYGGMGRPMQQRK